MTATNEPAVSATAHDAERREFDALLASSAFARSSNLQRFLEFIGTKYFEGKTDEIKEYTVAVHALNRPEDFDPRADTIVRVTAVALRKRLELYYATEGASHPVQMDLPPGQYVPRFVHRTIDPAASPPVAPPAAPASRGRWLALAALVLVAMPVAVYVLGLKPPLPFLRSTAPVVTVPAGKIIRFLPGQGRASYNDASGDPWLPDTFCQGGQSFERPIRDIQGTDDPTLFSGGRQGRTQCRVPVSPGTYEVHLYFAEAAGGKEAMKQVVFRLNDGAPYPMDVVNDAPGPETATAKVIPDVQPMEDGSIHIDFVSDDAFVNAIEVAPSTPGKPLPLRILAGRATYRDQKGNVWQSDRFFFGGRRTYRAEGLPDVPDQGLFQWERFGHFRYNLPVAQGREYAVTLYFSEGWFGRGGDSGGVGSRTFDVYCNGTTLLHEFDILREQANGVAVKTFRRVKPTAQGKIELSFVPVTNYPLINAIEVVAED
jgi:hypothetical protein